MKEGDHVEWNAASRVFRGTIVGRTLFGTKRFGYQFGWIVRLADGKAIIADENSLRYEKGQLQF